MPPRTYIVLGAGVIGLTTALHLHATHPTARIILTARLLPGDRDPAYTSPWAGANWLSTATDNGRQEAWDAATYARFAALAAHTPEAGVRALPIHAFFDNPVEEAGVLSVGTGKVWYEGLTGLRWLGGEEVGRVGAVCGFEARSFVIDTQVYLPWLQGQALKAGIEIRRGVYEGIHDLFAAFPDADAFFNCTGLGSYHLKGVEDKNLYPTRGQTLLVEMPASGPMPRMYFRSPRRVDNDTTYVFPRNPYGGVVLGGCRLDGVWDGTPDLAMAEDIKRRCCALAPELGRPEDLKVVYHGVGLRPSRKGGPRIEKEVVDGRTLVHNYGASGAGYQASWGMAKEAVYLLQRAERL